jgi:prevent-host-death family protein
MGMDNVTASKLRENIYTILDQALDTGIPVEIVRNGRILRIVPDEPPSKLARLQPREIIVGDPEDLVNMDWSGEWSETQVKGKAAGV